MITIHFGLWLMITSCVWTEEYIYDYGLENAVTTIEQRYSYWPSMHNALIRKRELSDTAMSEGGGAVPSINPVAPGSAVTTAPAIAPVQAAAQPSEQTNLKEKVDNAKSVISADNITDTNIIPSNGTAANKTLVSATKQLDFNQPGVLMRGVIVFGGFSMLAVVYYLFYKTKGKKNDSSNTHNAHDNNQFRYGFLESDDRRDTMELGSRVPLTLESDEDEDEDLEIFDLGQKKKTLSYVNLQTNDEDIVFQKSTENGSNDKDNILLDIEDSTSDPLINWSHNGNKSIL